MQEIKNASEMNQIDYNLKKLLKEVNLTSAELILINLFHDIQ